MVSFPTIYIEKFNPLYTVSLGLRRGEEEGRRRRAAVRDGTETGEKSGAARGGRRVLSRGMTRGRRPPARVYRPTAGVQTMEK